MDYAAENNLSWIDDVNNRNLAFDRNYLRHEVLPQLEERWPSIQAVLARTAMHCAEAQELLEQIAEQDLENCWNEKLNTLSISVLKKLSPARLKNVLRFWIHRENFLLPTEIHMQHILHDVIFSAQDRKAKVSWDKVEIKRFRNDLYLLPKQKKWNAAQKIHWNLSQELKIPGLGIIKTQPQKARGIAKKYLLHGVEVGFRSYGERCHPQDRGGSHPLKKLFQEWNIPPWERDKVPLIYIGNQLAAVVGYCVCQQFSVQNPEEEGVDFEVVSTL